MSSSGSAKISSSGSASWLSSSSGSSSSSGPVCDWEIANMTYVAANEMGFTVDNHSPDPLTVVSIICTVDPGASITAAPWPVIPPGGFMDVGVVSSSDLRLTTVTVTTVHCGSKTAEFPLS